MVRSRTQQIPPGRLNVPLCPLDPGAEVARSWSGAGVSERRETSVVMGQRCYAVKAPSSGLWAGGGGGVGGRRRIKWQRMYLTCSFLLPDCAALGSLQTSELLWWLGAVPPRGNLCWGIRGGGRRGGPSFRSSPAGTSGGEGRGRP